MSRLKHFAGLHIPVTASVFSLKSSLRKSLISALRVWLVSDLEAGGVLAVGMDLAMARKSWMSLYERRMSRAGKWICQTHKGTINWAHGAMATWKTINVLETRFWPPVEVERPPHWRHRGALRCSGMWGFHTAPPERWPGQWWTVPSRAHFPVDMKTPEGQKTLLCLNIQFIQCIAMSHDEGDNGQNTLMGFYYKQKR